jgi:hypothetical protein
MQQLHATFTARGWLVAQAVPFDDPDWNYKAYAAATDYLILMAYDQHWSRQRRRTIAAQDWFEQNLNSGCANSILLKPSSRSVIMATTGTTQTRTSTKSRFRKR